MKVKVISLQYIFQVLYVLCFTRPRYQVSVYRTIGPLVNCYATADILTKLLQQCFLFFIVVVIPGSALARISKGQGAGAKRAQCQNKKGHLRPCLGTA